MAIITTGPIVTGIRGSIGAVTFSNSRSGPTARRRQKPVYPRSLVQGRRNAALAAMAQEWRDSLSAAQRTAWNTLAASTNFTNSLGQTYQIPGAQLWIRSATSLLLVDENTNQNAPLAATEVAPDMTLSAAATPTISIATWPNFDNVIANRVKFYISAAVPPTQNFPPTRFRNIGFQFGGAFVALPRIVATAPEVENGKRYFMRMLVVRNGVIPGPPPNSMDGRVSFETILPIDVP